MAAEAGGLFVLVPFNKNMLLKITIRHVPTSVSIAAQRSGWPENASPRMAAFVVTDNATFSMIFRRVVLESLMACGIRRMSLDMRVMCPVSVATAEPATPIEIPTSAVAKAGASFIPSPTMAVDPSFFSSLMIVIFSSGSSSAWTTPMACPSYKHNTHGTKGYIRNSFSRAAVI